MENALTMAAQIASKSPVAVQGTKDNLNFSRFDPYEKELGEFVYREILVFQSHYINIYIVSATYLRIIISFQLTREHPVQEGLDRVAMYNMSMLQVCLI